MKRAWVFEGEEQLRLYERKKEFLERLLRELCPRLDLRSGLDTGCGIGLFSKCLSELGLSVTAFDARSENIEEAKRRYPEVEFVTRDVEDRNVRELGFFHLVLCFGLLYHLENPFAAIRNLYAVTKRILVIESRVSGRQSPVATLISECQGEDQGVRHVAFVPSEHCLVKMLYRAGFAQVYRASQLPDHEDFQQTLFHGRHRTVLVASKIRFDSRLLRAVSEPQSDTSDLWRREWTFTVPRLAQLGRLAKKPRLGAKRRH